MPQVFRMGEYWIYFWTNEGDPIEPVHVHIAKGHPTANSTKVWITNAGKCYLCNNNSQIPSHTLRNIMRMVEARSEEILNMWNEYFGEIHFYC
ncbi:MAG: DUF4160 domain-containing protein [Lachnospiraceae bacterium]|nr:DUF4160 domain-containing protein [Lachnospiraceae bacterium]